MRMYIHQLLHIPANLYSLGPLCHLWQYALEGYGGHLMRSVQSRSRPIENMISRELVNQGVDAHERSNAGNHTQRVRQSGSSTHPNFRGCQLQHYKGIQLVDSDMNTLLKEAYTREVMNEATNLLYDLDRSMCSIIDEWGSSEATIKQYAALVKKGIKIGSLLDGATASNESRCSYWVRVNYPWDMIDFGMTKFPLRHLVVERFISHVFRGDTHLWAVCRVPVTREEYGSLESGYRRCPLTKTFHFTGMSSQRILINVRRIESKVGFLKNNEDVYIMDNGHMPVYIEKEVPESYD
ncbi:uncharacterized protein BJ171DRAFT_516091 [Polychytrium aggregatum]|uniref:uncharacterized protein n=1 Tax=Polychytrium aggregatum TaxID=110093 RepID=UPI0022FE7255|nr:uncharacterized protein BJ171DRAFT_516091 [Polychytrium aggregatum]KAI9201975.1 hypothetical protein BJ171DRAFT_516091 [Polychytrium aggregatum]